MTEIQIKLPLVTSNLRDIWIRRLKWHFSGPLSYYISYLFFLLCADFIVRQSLSLWQKNFSWRPWAYIIFQLGSQGKSLCLSQHYLFNFRENFHWSGWGHMNISKPMIMAKGMEFSVLPVTTFLLYLRVWRMGKWRVPTESVLGPHGLCECGSWKEILLVGLTEAEKGDPGQEKREWGVRKGVEEGEKGEENWLQCFRR